MKDNKININFLTIVLIFSVFATGLFHEFLSCFISVVLCVYLFFICKKKSTFALPLSISSIAVFLISVSYGFVSIWAIDRGDAVIGFFKFLPIILFLLIIVQDEDEKPDIVFLPYAMAVMTVVSSILMQFPSLRKYFSVSGRLSGFLQYSNTFALLLLISLIILVTKEKLKRFDFVVILILLFGIFYSGSRTVFVLMVFALLFMIFASKNKKIKVFLLTSTVAGIAIIVLYALATNNFDTIGRFLTISFKDSTFLGRILYFTDALPIILKHPFGLGYMGYYYLQQSFQTGIYSVKYIHNDFLQFMLDIGWVPAISFIAAIVSSFFKKGNSVRNRLVLLILSMHCCFDFNLQYIAVFFILILFLDYEGKKEISLPSSTIGAGVGIGIVAILCLYIGIAQMLFTINNYSASHKLYPWNTQISIAQLSRTNDIDEMNQIANEIIENNEYVPVAYSAKSNVAYSKGDIKSVIAYKNKVFEIAPFSYNEYEQYCYMMINAAKIYANNGDEYSEKICLEEFKKSVDAVENMENKLSKLGKMINDQPTTTLPNDIIEFAEVID